MRPVDSKFIFYTVASVYLTPLFAASVAYRRNDTTLTSFPVDIPADVTVIELRDHAISDVAYIQPLVNLTTLDLGNNSLLEFPDLGNVAESLVNLNLEDNQITEIWTARVLPLHSLESLVLSNNPLASLPNFGLLPKPPQLALTLDGLEFDCGWRMAALKLAELAGKVTFPGATPVCSSPPQLAGLDWASVTVDDMTNPANLTTSYGQFAPFAGVASMSTYPTVSDVIANVDGKWCARRCVQSHDCTMYALDGATGCVLANLTAGPAAAVTAYTAWYIKL